MASFNKVILCGNLTRDPETRYTAKGTAVCQVGLAINRNWTNEAGEKKEEVTFVEVSAFGRTAENIGQYMKKGRPMLVEGRLRLEQWDDKQTGAKRSKLSVIVETCQFLGGNKDEAAPRAERPRAERPAPEVAGDEPPEDDQVPF